MAHQQDIYESYIDRFTRGMRDREVPNYMVDGAVRYIMNGIEPGGFLQAVICNKLVQSFNKADDTNRRCIYNWADVLYNVFPSESWGTEDKYNKWIKSGGIIGQIESERNDSGDNHGENDHE